MPSMEGVKSTLTHKVGPLPLWGYGVAAGGVLVIVRARRKSKSASSSAGEQQAASQFGGLDPSAYGYQGGQNFGGGTSGDVMSMFQTLQSQLGAIQAAAARATTPAASSTGTATSSAGDRTPQAVFATKFSTTLNDIAATYGVTPDAIWAANPDLHGYQGYQPLPVGTTVYVPPRAH